MATPAATAPPASSSAVSSGEGGEEPSAKRIPRPPEVPRFSSLLNYLERCEVGYSVQLNVLIDDSRSIACQVCT